jgi:fibronectin-binding autotransporter adhesin
MITEPVYIDVPIFATLGTKVEPDADIFTNGYAVDTVLPTEHLSYFFNGFTSNDITVEEAVDALIVELTAILTAAGLTPNPLITNQILLSLNSLYANTAGGSSLAGTTTVTGTLTSSGGTLSGSWAGNPTLSGNPTFSGTPVFSNAATISGTATVSGTLTSSGGTLSGSWAGSPTLSGNPTFSGTPVFSGTPNFQTGATMAGTFSGTKTFSGTNTISGTLTSSGGTMSGSWAGNPTFSGTPVFSTEITVAGHNIAPRPKDTSGIGQWTYVSGTTTFVLPASGTWAWLIFDGTGSNPPSYTGIDNGGSTITGRGATTFALCWRIT